MEFFPSTQALKCGPHTNSILGNLFDEQMFGPHPRPSEAVMLGRAWQSLFPGVPVQWEPEGPWAKACCSLAAELRIQQCFLHRHGWKVLLITCCVLALGTGALTFLGENSPSAARSSSLERCEELAQLSCSSSGKEPLTGNPLQALCQLPLAVDGGFCSLISICCHQIGLITHQHFPYKLPKVPQC